MTKRHLIPMAGLALVVASCERVPERQAPDQDPTPPPAPVEQVTPSIIRPDVLPQQPEAAPDPLELTVPFAEGGTALREAAEAVLGQLLESRQFAEGWPIVLRGHTDSAGHDEANLRVSRRRAEAVAEWLTERGVDPGRIEIVALGEQRPVAPNARLDGTPDEEGRARNRRVTVSIAPPETDSAADDSSSEAGGEEPDG